MASDHEEPGALGKLLPTRRLGTADWRLRQSLQQPPLPREPEQPDTAGFVRKAEIDYKYWEEVFGKKFPVKLRRKIDRIVEEYYRYFDFWHPEFVVSENEARRRAKRVIKQLEVGQEPDDTLILSLIENHRTKSQQ